MALLPGQRCGLLSLETLLHQGCWLLAEEAFSYRVSSEERLVILVSEPKLKAAGRPIGTTACLPVKVRARGEDTGGLTS